MPIVRIKPDPVPEVNPFWEFKAEGELRLAYENYKRALQVPWVGVVSMAYAHYRSFFDAWWQGMEPLVGSKIYVETAFSLRMRVEKSVGALNPPSLVKPLRDMGYSVRELDEIRDMIEVLSHGNFIQLPAVFAARMLLEGHELTAAAPVETFAGAHARPVKTPFILMEPHHALPDLGAIYGDVKEQLGLPFVNTDYRCLSRWPSYFDTAWKSLRLLVNTSAYEELALDMHEAVVAAVRTFPNPGGVTAAAVQAGAHRDATIGEVLEVTKLFTWLLPGLMVNVAYFRAQLEE